MESKTLESNSSLVTKDFKQGGSQATAYFLPEQRHRGRAYAFFGNWKMPDGNQEGLLAEQRELFQQIFAWAKAMGTDLLVGPIDSSTYGSYRLKKDYFGAPAYLSEPQNSELQSQLIAQLGFKEEQTYSTYINSNIPELKSWIARFKGPDFEKLAKEYEFKLVNPQDWQMHLLELWNLTNVCFAENPFFQPLSFSDYQLRFGSEFVLRTCLKTSLLVKSRNSGQVVASLINLRGKDSKELIVKTIGILPEHRYRGQMFLQIMKELAVHLVDTERLVFCLMKDGNFPSLLAKPLIHEHRTYAVYSRDL